MISHSCWKNDDEILSWAHTNKYGNKYYLLKDIQHFLQMENMQ